MTDLITRQALAERLGVTVRTLRTMHESGVLRWIPVTPGGRKVVYRVADVERYLAQQEGAA